MGVVGRMSAGLCGEPMPMTKGVLELDALLGRRSGSEESESAVDAVERVRG
jgi:hypothetical protein